jgi:hypothetical protein
MGEILEDSEAYIVQWWDDFYDRWQDNTCLSLEHAKQEMADMKTLDKKAGEKIKYRIVKEVIKQEVVYDDKD